VLNVIENLNFLLALLVCELPDFERLKPYFRFITSFRARVIGLGKDRHIGPNVRIERKFLFSKRLKLIVGAGSVIKNNVTITGKHFEIGEGSSILAYTNIDATSSVKIGSRTCVGKNCEIYSHTHLYSKKETPIFDAPEIDEPVTIGHDVLLYGNVVVVGGVNIGEGAVIGNRSVVTKSLDAFGIFFGIPARKVDQRV
jgi:acetyltransferase-like isoleucine patch superfamily enzyme